MSIQYAVCHLERGSGNDSGMSCHIERKTADGKTYIPDNADESRTHLNRELISFPKGVANRTQAIQYRLDHGALQRKVGKNQTRAVRILLSGSPEQMAKLAHEGKIDRWCEANLKWLNDTFGDDNVVSCVLHIDEKTPHPHATVVPIVTAPRQRRKREGEKKYKEKEPRPRLCADEVMSRSKLRQYQDSYAKAMSGFGLKRGIVASGAIHQSQQQYKRQQALELQANIDNLLNEIATLEEQKKDLEAAARDGKNRMLSFFGKGEFPKLKKEVEAKDQEIAKLKSQIAALEKERDNLKAESLRERNAYQKEIDAAAKRAAEWERSFNAERERSCELHRKAYPERYRLSSGAELLDYWIPNRRSPSITITTRFHGKEFKNSTYSISSLLFEKYERDELTLHELINGLFEPRNQVDQSQHHLLAVAMQTAAGGVPLPHIGTGGGGSSSDLPWNDRDRDGKPRRKSKGRG